MKNFVAALLLMSGFLVAGGANANISIIANEVGSNVVISISGSLDLASFGSVTSGTSGGAKVLVPPDQIFNLIPGNYNRYTVNPGVPSSAFANQSNTATTSSGDTFAIDSQYVYLPSGYGSNTQLTSSMTFNNKSFSTMQLVSGTYVWTLPGSQTVTLFIGPPTAPTAATNAASSITATAATLNGTVNDNGASTTVIFNYGTTVSYGSTVTAAQSPLAAVSGSTSVSAALTGLTCNTTYHYQVSATNSINTTNGSDATFTTSACAAPPASIPSLSEWTQLLLALMAITLVGWHFHRERSY